MGYSTCSGNIRDRHEKRTCDGCDKCPSCAEFAPVKMSCWYCCGELTACPDCAPKIAQHVVSKGAPPSQLPATAWTGYRAALKVPGHNYA